jgi:hypothetical protein
MQNLFTKIENKLLNKKEKVIENADGTTTLDADTSNLSSSMSSCCCICVLMMAGVGIYAFYLRKI